MSLDNYKSLINDLVSLETKLKRIGGMSLSYNFDFYNRTAEKQRFHYKIEIDGHFEVPVDSFELRVGHYYRKNNCWYYCRKFFIFEFKMEYNLNKNIFKFNRSYHLYSNIHDLFPITFGATVTAGRNVMDVITMDLFLSDILFIGGIAVRKNDKTTCLIAPSCNGKTSNLLELLKNKAQYIAEDILIIDTKTEIVYPTCPNINNYGRPTNRYLKRIDKANIITKPQQIDGIIFAYNTMNNCSKRICSVNYIFTNCLNFLDNPMIKAVLFGENSTEKIIGKLDNVSLFFNEKKTDIGNHYDFTSLFDVK